MFRTTGQDDSGTSEEMPPGHEKHHLTEAMTRNNNIEEVERILAEASESQHQSGRSNSISDLVNLPIGQGCQTALHIAATEGFFDLVCLLLQNGGNINILDKNDWSPLHCSATNKHLDVCEVLLKQRADINLLTDSGTSAFDYMVRINVEPKQNELFKRVLSLMAERGQSLNTQNKHGETPLHQACFKGSEIAIRWLLDNKADINIVNRYKETPLHFACRSGHQRAVRLLLEAGANPDVEGAYGTPRGEAEKLNFTNILETIEEFEDNNSMEDYSSDEDGSELSHLMDAIPKDIMMTISHSPYSQNLTPVSSIRHNKRRTNRAVPRAIQNGPHNLPAGQRRLRHLKTICIRNLKPQANWLIDCYVTIHTLSQDSDAELEIYRSTPIKNTLNPTWDFNIDSMKEYSTLSKFSLKLWNCKMSSHINEPDVCVLTTNIRMNRLSYIAPELQLANIPAPSMVYLELHDGFYIKEEYSVSYSSNNNSSSMIDVSKKFATTNSYSRTHFSNLLKLNQRVQAAVEENKKLKETLEQKLSIRSGLLQKKVQRDALEISTNKLSEKITEQTQTLEMRRTKLLEMKEEIIPQAKNISKALIDILSTKQELKKKIKEINIKKSEALALQEALEARQSTLIKQLRSIFVISSGTDQNTSLRINGTKLPNTEFTGCAEEDIATALGYVCQVLYMLSKWLEVPLRYPLGPALSRSYIRDHISNVSVAGNKYPLYSRGVDRTRFEYAVYLLNKDLEQLLNSQDLNIITLRHTLPNLQLLLITRGGKRPRTSSAGSVANAPAQRRLRE